MSRESRRRLIEKIQKDRGSKLLIFFLGDRPNQATKIANDAIPIIFEHLKAFDEPSQIDLFIYTRGGLITTPPRLVELLREFSNKLCVLIPYKCHSAGTLVALGANEILMTKMGELSPVEPQLGGIEDPKADPIRQKIPTSVENFASYISFAKEMVGITEQEQLGIVLKELTEKVSPVELGGVHRAYMLIRLIVKNLLSHHMKQTEQDQKIQQITDVIIEKFFSHEYVISRKEAKKLGLKVKNPGSILEEDMWNLFKEFQSDLKLNEPYNSLAEIGDKDEKDVIIKRAVIESEGICHEFITKLKFHRNYASYI